MMSTDERIDHLEARLIAYGIAISLMLDNASPETKASLKRAASAVPDRGLSTELTDTQIEQVQSVLLSLCN